MTKVSFIWDCIPKSPNFSASYKLSFTLFRKKRDAIEGQTFLDFNTKGGNEETQELSSILRLFDISEQRYLCNFLFQCNKPNLNFHLTYYRSENAENEPEKLKIPVAEPTDKRDNIFMIQGDDYLDRLEEKLTR